MTKMTVDGTRETTIKKTAFDVSALTYFSLCPFHHFQSTL